MALEQRYSWNEHLQECPKCNGKSRAKRVKRTSKEGAACFDKAYVIHIKDYLKSRISHLEEEQKRIAAARKTLMKRFIEETDTEKARRLSNNISLREAYLQRIEHHLTRDKERQKKF